jgi:U3 small nucleolar RNA-associated protein 7
MRFIPHRDLLAVSHSSSSDKSGILAHDHVISTVLIPGSGNPNYDTAEGGDPHEGRKGRREREVRSLLEKLEPSTITVDPEMLGSLREPGKVVEGLVHRKQPRMQRLQATGKADETEVQGEEDKEDNQSGEEKPEAREKKKARKMRGKDKSMKRYLRKKRKNVVDEATVCCSPYLDGVISLL